MNQQKATPFKNPLKNPLIIALDVDSDQQALKLAHDLAPYAGAFKIGPRLGYRYGQKIVQEISKLAPVFVDNKYFDIPSTIEAAVQASFYSGASLVTVHALSGLETLQSLAKLEAELQKERPFIILNVTLLTSWDQNSLPTNFKKQSVEKHVQELVDLVKQSHLSGLVCSAQDLSSIDTTGLFVVTPGIRFEEDNKSEQKRVMAPSAAIKAGAKGLVVGRPIIEAKNPIEKAKSFLEVINAKQ